MEKSRCLGAALVLLMVVSFLPAIVPALAVTNTIIVSYNTADGTSTENIQISYTSGGEPLTANLTWAAQAFDMDQSTNWTILTSVSNGTDRYSQLTISNTPVAVNGTQYNVTYLHETYDSFTATTGGSVSTAGGWIGGGETPYVTATANVGYEFVGWYNDLDLYSTSTTFTPTFGGPYVAVFAASDVAACNTMTDQMAGILAMGALIILALIAGIIFMVLGRSDGSGIEVVMLTPVFIIAISIMLAVGLIILYAIQNAVCI
jgi:hypothetical protein